MSKYWQVARKDVVEILPSAYANDALAGGVWTVVDTQGSDALLARGDWRHCPPTPDEWDVAVPIHRLRRLA